MGSPSAWRRRTLGSGDVLLLPGRRARAPEGAGAAEEQNRAPLQPDVPVKLGPHWPAVTDDTAPLSLESDVCLSKAVDLLTAIRALASKHF